MIPEIIFFLLLFCNVYLFLVSWAATRNKKRESEREENGAKGNADPGSVLLVIAHPDDEAMFFVPTIRAILGHDHNPTIPSHKLYILCLSNGNGDGLGAIRALEMVASAESLGVHRDHVKVIDDPLLQDGMSVKWEASVVASHVSDAVDKFRVSKILTFDNFGVSGHPNHIDTHHGVLHFLHNSVWGRLGNATFCGHADSDSTDAQGLRRRLKHDGDTGSEYHDGRDSNASRKGGEVYLLQSTGLFRKYLGLFDVLTSLLSDHGGEDHQCMCSFSPWVNYRAMQAHASQFVWYRRLFVIFSRYTFVNNLTKLRAST